LTVRLFRIPVTTTAPAALAKPLAPTSKWVDAMMSSAKNEFAAEVRAVEVRMVLDHGAE
jgi:hypothetical protein